MWAVRRDCLPFGLFLLSGKLYSICDFCFGFRSWWKERQGKQEQVWSYWVHLIPDTCCDLFLFFLLYSDCLFFFGDCQLHSIVPWSRIMPWCRDEAGSNNSEQNRPILFTMKSKFRCGLPEIWHLYLMFSCRLQIVFLVSYFEGFFSQLPSRIRCVIFLTNQKWRNSLKLHYCFIKQN